MTNGLSLEELMKEGTYPEEYAEGENWRILHGDTLKLVKALLLPPTVQGNDCIASITANTATTPARAA